MYDLRFPRTAVAVTALCLALGSGAAWAQAEDGTVGIGLPAVEWPDRPDDTGLGQDPGSEDGVTIDPPEIELPERLDDGIPVDESGEGDWSGEDWGEEGWEGEDWTEEDWTDEDWTEEDWTEEDWTEEDWTEEDGSVVEVVIVDDSGMVEPVIDPDCTDCVYMTAMPMEDRAAAAEFAGAVPVAQGEDRGRGRDRGWTPPAAVARVAEPAVGPTRGVCLDVAMAADLACELVKDQVGR